MKLETGPEAAMSAGVSSVVSTETATAMGTSCAPAAPDAPDVPAVISPPD